MKMNGLFNIAVAPFSQVDTNGKLEFSNEGLELSDWVYKQLTKEIKETDALIWSDKIPKSQKGTTLGIITGTTPAERQQSAERLAVRVGAQMVIFGQLSGNESAGEFTPEFYIATSAQKLKGEAEEVLGSHQLGTPIRIPRPMQLNADEALMLNQNLNSRAIFVKGVLLDLLGLHVVAYKEFEKIEQSWSKDEVAGTGKEVLPQFMARELVFMLDQPANLADLGMSRDEALAQAQKLVRKALSNPNYGLAYLQQGNLAISRAEPVLRTFISEMLSQNTVTFTAEYSPAKAEIVSATQAYSQFLSLSKGSADTASQTKAQISLANALRLQAYTQWLEGQFDAAVSTFERANQTLDLAFVAGDIDKPRLRVTAQWVRGDIAVGQAIVVYQLGDDAGYAAFLQSAKLALESCVQQKGDLDETLKTIQKQCQQKLDGITGAQ
jgi:tetratricopeptide (TPR) repeat protein